jgi:hypothetical protein
LRSKEFPSGSDRHGYEFVAPLNARWAHRSPAVADLSRTLRRASIPGGRGRRARQLVHRPGSAEHARWAFDYDETAEHDDEASYRFADHVFRNGEYVWIRGEDGEMQTFRVVSVEPTT